MSARQDSSTGRKIPSNACQDNLPAIQDDLKVPKDSSKTLKDNSPGRKDISKGRQDRLPAPKIHAVVLQDNCNDKGKVVLKCFHVLLTSFSSVLNRFLLVLKTSLPALKPFACLLTKNRVALNLSDGTKMQRRALLTAKEVVPTPYPVAPRTCHGRIIFLLTWMSLNNQQNDDRPKPIDKIKIPLMTHLIMIFRKGVFYIPICNERTPFDLDIRKIPHYIYNYIDCKEKSKILYMKTISILLISMFILSSCSSNRYLLTDKGKDSKFLINTIKKSSASGEVKRKPIIVIDGKPYRYDYELKTEGLQISKKDIKQIDILKKDVGVEIYGEYAKDGVIIVTTKSSSSNDSKPYNDSKVLILLENKEISQSEMEAIDPNDVESIEVIKNKEKVKSFTSEDYDGVVIIHMKKIPAANTLE